METSWEVTSLVKFLVMPRSIGVGIFLGVAACCIAAHMQQWRFCQEEWNTMENWVVCT